jgi:GDP-4-dehydro-6-deoxy-D-mannose reductase
MGQGLALVTGATGFLGIPLMQHLLSTGGEVVGTYQSTVEGSPSGAQLMQVDLANADAVAHLIRLVSPETVYHLAAHSSAGASWTDPLAIIAYNTTLQFNVLEAIRHEAPLARVVCVSSGDVYGGTPSAVSVHDETAEFRPRSPYALSKVAQDAMAGLYADVHGMHVVRVRPFLQIGPRRATSFAAGSFACQVAEIEAGLRPARMNVGNLDLRRDMTDVRDVARALVRALDQGEPGEVFNIATGESRSLRELLHTMLRNAGITVEIAHDDRLLRRCEPADIIGDARKLRARTGWRPLIAFEESAVDTLNYWRERVRNR